MTTPNRHLRAVPDGADEPKRAYSAEYRRAAVARVSAGEPIAAVVRDLGVARNTLKAWVRDETPSEVVSGGSALVNGGSAVVAAAASGSRRDVLVALRDETATKIAGGLSSRDFPAHARLLDETVQAIAAIDAAARAEEETAVADDEPFNPEDI